MFFVGVRVCVCVSVIIVVDNVVIYLFIFQRICVFNYRREELINDRYAVGALIPRRHGIGVGFR